MARADSPRISPHLSPGIQGCLARMHARDFASVFPPKPSLFRREEYCAYGGGAGPASWKRNVFNEGRREHGALRPDRLGGSARVARFGKFRAKGSSRVTLPPFPHRKLGGKFRAKGSPCVPLPPLPHHGHGLVSGNLLLTFLSKM